MGQTTSFNKYLPIALLYFFFNNFLLPSGLLYTSLLTPLLFIWLIKYPTADYTWYFLLFTVPYAVIHYFNGIHLVFYVKSYLLLFSAFIFGLCFYQFLKTASTLRSIFKYLLVANFITVIIAGMAWFIPSLRDVFWLTSRVSIGLEKISRLKLLTYEPSYYSTLLVPIAMYYYLKMILLKLPNTGPVAVLITIPLLLSFSFGILLGIPLALAILFVFNMNRLLAHKKIRQLLSLAFILGIISLTVILFVFPNNPLFIRINNILEGSDTSFSGRTYDAFYLAWELIKQKSVLFGVGLGQIKVLGLDLWNNYYHYNFTVDSIAIPCAAADTLAAFGVTGFALRIGLQVYFFFRTKVYSNYYRFALFIFIFIYQFTGSYINNIAEFVIWILAFTNVFEEFDRKNIAATTTPQIVKPA